MAKYNNGEYGSSKRMHTADYGKGVEGGLSEKKTITDSPESLGMHAVSLNQKPGPNMKHKVAGGHICW